MRTDHCEKTTIMARIGNTSENEKYKSTVHQSLAVHDAPATKTAPRKIKHTLQKTETMASLAIGALAAATLDGDDMESDDAEYSEIGTS